MWVVWNNSTGYSDESMRFATAEEAEAFVDSRNDNEFGDTYAMRYEP